MTYVGTFTLNPSQISVDAGSRLRTSAMYTLGDYKTLNSDKPMLLETVGSGTGTFTNNKYNMAVASGQWMVRRSRRFHPYFSGKSQMIEMTFDNFQTETNVVKRAGYYSSNAVSPYDLTYDGFWLENDGTTIRLKVSRAGTSTLDVPITSWDGYSAISTYDWSKFTVIMFDFLWLGGAVLRLWLKTSAGFVLCHTFNYSGSSADTFIKSPNQPIRFEIRSSTGVGALRAVCAQVSTETGSVSENGVMRYVDTGTTFNVQTIGTTYPIKAIRKLATHRDIAVQIEAASLLITTSDTLIWSFQINPTLSAPLTYGTLTNSAVEHADGNGVITVTSPGIVIGGGLVTTTIPMSEYLFDTNYLSFLSSSITNTMDEYILCATPLTTAISVYGGLSFKEF